VNVKSAFQTSLNFKENKIEIRVFCKTKRNKKKKQTLFENKSGKIKEKSTQKQRKQTYITRSKI